MKYRYEITGSAAGGQTWISTGEIETRAAGDFPTVPGLAMEQSFMKLTNGEAVYGLPGVRCDGPYGITRMVIEKVKAAGG
jgi:hypothetical protein